MEAIGAASSVLALVELTTEVLSYLKAVHDAGKDRDAYLQEAPNFCVLLTRLYVHIEAGGPPGEQNTKAWFESVRTLWHGPLQQYEDALRAFTDKVAPAQTGRAQRIVKRLAWPFVKEDVKDILAKMERLKSLITIDLLMDHLYVSCITPGDSAGRLPCVERPADLKNSKLSEATNNTVSDVKNDTTAIRATGEQLSVDFAALHLESHKQSDVLISAQDAKRKDGVMRWLSEEDYAVHQQESISRHKKGTGAWLLTDPKFQDWKTGSCETLLCEGMPGAGKTVMSATVIRHLTEEAPREAPDSKVAVAFVYFRYDERATHSLEGLLGSLTRQLVRQTTQTVEQIDRAFWSGDMRIPRVTKPDLEEHEMFLKAAVECFDRVYFVVDALDEGPDPHRSRLVSSIQDLPRDKVKLLATSRPIGEIKRQFVDATCLEIRGSDLDIKEYAMGRLGELTSCVRSSAELQEQVVQAVVASTEGMFLLAKLHMDSLKGKRTVKAVKAALQKLPSGSGSYDAAYDLAMERISDQSDDAPELARTVLTWVVHAGRPLTETELETALAIEVGEVELDPDNTIPATELLSLCAGLLTVDEEARVVRLIHYTTQEYFTRHQQWLLQDPHRVLCNACLSYLCLDIFKHGDFMDGRNDQDWDSRWNESETRPEVSHAYQYPFFGYAAMQWEDHHKAAEASDYDDADATYQSLQLMIRFFSQQELVNAWRRVLGEWVNQSLPHLSNAYDQYLFQENSGLQYAVARQDYQLVSGLLALGCDPDAQGSALKTTALIDAVDLLNEPLVRLLIDAKANIHAEDDYGRTALAALHLCANSWEFKELGDGTPDTTRASIEDVLRRAGSDPHHVCRGMRLWASNARERSVDTDTLEGMRRRISVYCGDQS